jgi:hypothetical protein
MLTTCTWTITDVKAYENVDGREKQVYAISYTIAGEKNGLTASISDTCPVNYLPGGQWIPYEELTEDILRSWAQSIMHKETEEKILESKIDAQASQVVSGLPWNTN